MQQIDVVAVFLKGKPPMPKRIRYNEQTVIVDKILDLKEIRYGRHSYIYRCQSRFDEYGYMREYELKYVIDDCVWYLDTE